MPTCGNSGSSSNAQIAPRPGRSYQRASRAFTANQPSFAGTSSCPESSIRAAPTRASAPQRLGVAAGGLVALLAAEHPGQLVDEPGAVEADDRR